MEYEIIALRDHPQWAEKAARWFHSKWKVPLAAYEESMAQCLAGALLSHVCTDMAAMGIDTLYLATEHTSFYERYGWEFFCEVRGDGEDHLSRLYRHRMK